MAVKLADAKAYLGADDSELNSKLASAERNMQGSGNKFSSVLQGIGMSVGMGVAGIAVNALGQMKDFMGDSVTAASDLGETISKVGVIFEDGAGSILEWSEASATSIGQSQEQALSAAANFATFGKAAGLSGEDLSGFASELTTLASDLASFNNTSPEQAIDAIGAALRGEAEPMRQFGVLLDDASLRNQALKMGLIETTKDALTPQQKVLAAHALIMAQTADAQGDFARTSGGLANQQRILDAQMESLKTTIGSALLPVMTTLTTAMNGLLTNVLPPLVDFMKTNVTPVFQAIADTFNQMLGPAIQMIAAWFGSLGTTMQGQTDGPFAYLAEWFTENMPRIQKIVGDALAAISAFWTEYGDEIMAVVGWLFEFVVTNIQDSMKTVMDIVQAILQIITGDFSGAGDTLGGIMDRWRERILGAWAAITTGIKDWWNGIDWGEMGRSILEGLAAGITGAVGLAVSAMQNAGRAILDAIKGFFGIRSPSQVMADEVGKPLVDGLLGGFQQALGVASEINGALFGGIGSFFGISGGGGVAVTVNVYTSSSDPAAVGAGAAEGVLAGLRAAGIR